MRVEMVAMSSPCAEVSPYRTAGFRLRRRPAGDTSFIVAL
jgi:hypothetical protein